VGGSAQTKAVKSVSGGLKLSLAQFRELASFAQFSTDLDAETKHRIERGQRLTELLKQKQYSPLSVAEQTASLMAANEGAFDEVPTEKMKDVQAELLSTLDKDHHKLMTELDKGGKPSDETQKTILDVAKKIARSYVSTKKAAKAKE
jgi:F-type H+-transporting ATPase subunit alpha